MPERLERPKKPLWNMEKLLLFFSGAQFRGFPSVSWIFLGCSAEKKKPLKWSCLNKNAGLEWKYLGLWFLLIIEKPGGFPPNSYLSICRYLEMYLMWRLSFSHITVYMLAGIKVHSHLQLFVFLYSIISQQVKTLHNAVPQWLPTHRYKLLQICLLNISLQG